MLRVPEHAGNAEEYSFCACPAAVLRSGRRGGCPQRRLLRATVMDPQLFKAFQMGRETFEEIGQVLPRR